MAGLSVGFRSCRAPSIPGLWRKICFVLGVAAFYIVAQTHIDYYAQHMFFVHRAGAFYCCIIWAPS